MIWKDNLNTLDNNHNSFLNFTRVNELFKESNVNDLTSLRDLFTVNVSPINPDKNCTADYDDP